MEGSFWISLIKACPIEQGENFTTIRPALLYETKYWALRYCHVHKMNVEKKNICHVGRVGIQKRIEIEMRLFERK